MKNNPIVKSFSPIAIFFAIVGMVALAARDWLAARLKLDYLVLSVGNIVLFAATAFSFYLYSRALRSKNIQLFLRMMYSSLLAKMVFCLVATLLYLFVAGKDVNKAGILSCFVLYMVYTYIEVKVLMRLSKNSPKNG